MTVEQHDTKQHEREGPEVGRDKEDPENEMMSREGNNKEQQKTEEGRKKREEVEEDDDIMKEVCTQTAGDNVSRHQSTTFDWATNVDESPGPVPTFVDHTPAEHASCTPIT